MSEELPVKDGTGRWAISPLGAPSGSGKTAALYDLAGRTGALLVLQEDPKLLMWFDQALTRSGEEA